MNKENTPDGKKFMSGTLGEVFPACFERQKNDADRFACLRDPAQCPHNNVCFIQLQRALNKMFEANPDVIGGHFVFSTDKQKFMTRISAKTMIHELFEVKEDKYSPVGGSEKK